MKCKYTFKNTINISMDTFWMQQKLKTRYKIKKYKIEINLKML